MICPGFIDAHAHAEGPLLADGRVDGALAQGVTTLVVGQDGESWIGATAATARYLNQYFAPVNGALDPARDLERGRLPGRGLGQADPERRRAGLAGHDPAQHRRPAAGPLEPGERAAARRQVEDALADGAVGLSSGLDYLPSRFGGIDEVAEMARPLAAAGRPYVSHLRGYGSGGQGRPGRAGGRGARRRRSGCTPATCGARRLTSQAAFAAAETAGVGVTYDMYPYRRSSTILAHAAASARDAGPRPASTRWPRWPTPGSGRRCWRRRSSPAITCSTSTWAACPAEAARFAGQSVTAGGPRAMRGRRASGFSTCWSAAA